MKKIFLAALVFVSVGAHVNALDDLMPSLRRVRNKVEDALKQPGQSFKDILKNVKTDENGKQILTAGVVTAQGIEEKHDAVVRLNAAVNKYRSLFWAHNNNFFDALKTSAAQSREAGLSILAEYIMRSFSEEKAPLISFAAQLKEEETILDKCVTELFTLVTYKNKNEKPPVSFYQEAQDCLREAADLKAHVIELLNTIETLLLEK
ncbi:hypothetical protein IPF37_04805 [bacterium]|nr:MAG: hypothetical protein IPF37_04805 [bacterium]